ncbi:hypothetical protein [Lihuaxuella thermophila]|uniref:Uncharacterized protein n=1 Tax=Lihuaxuella thermophila TaxID=1173111 RepID=A0A1H8EMV4_9BACL|nr:hypothetical protein [Lihuaxuella thermophila]SEN20815.1 hypothetical protein SAMN05444955_10776 [Lihuaxuella thermophila]
MKEEKKEDRKDVHVVHSHGEVGRNSLIPIHVDKLLHSSREDHRLVRVRPVWNRLKRH